MVCGFSTGELVVLGVVLLVVLSASRMGAIGNALGRFVYSFKKAARGEDMVDVSPVRRLQSPPPEDAQIVEETKKR